MFTPDQAKALALEVFTRAPDDGASPRTDGQHVPSHIGGYRILRLLAHGGMGAVYEAEQEHPHRRVAIKVLKSHAFVQGRGRDALARFHGEVEILGRLEHPNIARLYDAGMHDDGFGGVPYFVMELLPDALPITEFAQRNSLGLRERLQLFAQACDGVQCGHQRGIVHRDLKPGNILVAGSGQTANSIPPSLEGGGRGVGATQNDGNAFALHTAPTGHEDVPARSVSLSASSPPAPPHIVKIIDFGVAHTTNADMTLVTAHTAAGELIGTLQYMSPEQCLGDSRELDTRSDVYALGAVLYELLCERLPYDVSHMTTIGAAKVIQNDDPAAPSRWDRRLRGDIEAIILKAMHKTRDRRYGTAGELATDIRRHLNGEPIVARKPGAWMKATRWMARHPVMTTAAMCAAMILFTVLSTSLSLQVLRKRPHAMRISANGREAALVSFPGDVLRSWDSGADNGISFADLVERPAELGGGKVALVGYRTTSPMRGLHIIPVSGAKRDEYVVALQDDDLTIQDRAKGTLAGGHFTIGHAAVVDVFPETVSPGKELLVVFQHNTSRSAVCLYDLSGKQLWRLWHNGNIYDCMWREEERVLLLAGMNGECSWSKRGQPTLPAAIHPQIALAVQPEFGAKSEHYLDTLGTDPQVLWYRCVLPAALNARVRRINFGAPNPGDSPGTCRMTMTLEDLQGGCGWSLVIREGRLVEGSAIPSTACQDNENAPDPAGITLGDLPPIIAPATREAENAAD